MKSCFFLSVSYDTQPHMHYVRDFEHAANQHSLQLAWKNTRMDQNSTRMECFDRIIVILQRNNLIPTKYRTSISMCAGTDTAWIVMHFQMKIIGEALWMGFEISSVRVQPFQVHHASAVFFYVWQAGKTVQS